MLPELRISGMALHIGEVIAECHSTISFEIEHYKLLRGYTKNLWPIIQKLPPTSWDYPFKTVELLHRYTAQYWKQFLLANVVYCTTKPLLFKLTKIWNANTFILYTVQCGIFKAIRVHMNVYIQHVRVFIVYCYDICVKRYTAWRTFIHTYYSSYSYLDICRFSCWSLYVNY